MAQKTVVLETTMGELEIEFYPEHAPKTVENFVKLVERKYYDNTISHRVIADFMVQLGDPTGTGRGGKSCWGEPFADEVSRALKHTGAGIVSMANSGPNTNGSQFFITLGPADWLDGKHTIFGRLTRGMRVLKRIGAVPVEQDRPKDEVKIIRAYISTGVRQQRPS